MYNGRVEHVETRIRTRGAPLKTTRAAVCAALLALDLALAAAGTVTPRRLAIYYGYPSMVEGAAGSVAHAVRVFGRYDVIIFGEGLELGAASADSTLRAEQPLVADIIARLHGRPQHPIIYGYVPLGRSQQLADAEIVGRIDAWQRLGADGIFFDQAGRDAGVTPARRSAAVRAAHVRGLGACMNASNPDDLFDKGKASRRPPDPGDLGASDALLIESFAVQNSVVQARDVTARRAAAAAKWRERTGVRLYAVTTTVDGRFDASSVVYAERLAGDLGIDAFGWGEPNFSVDTKMPWRFGGQ